MGKRIAVVGAGAIGGYSGGLMAKAGEDVTFIEMWPENVEYMRKHGLQLSGMTPEETHSIPVKALHICDVQSLAKQPPIDIAFISVKSYDTEWATALVKPYLAPDACVVSLQNGINEERIASVVGWGKVLGVAISLLSCELYKAGHVRRMVKLGGTQHIVYRAGEMHGRITPRAEEVARLLRHADSAKVSENLWGERWSKLVVNAMRNGLSTVTAMGGAARDTNDRTIWASVRLGSEAVRVGQALGYQLEEMQHMEPETLARAGEGDKAALAEITAVLGEASKRRSEEQRPSMAQDLTKGRRTETDFINGYVAAKGAEVGVPAPINAKMNELVKRVERGELKPGIDTLDLLGP